MLRLNFRTTIGSKINLNAGYTLGFANGDTDSLSSPGFQVNTIGFPAYNYDFSNEYAPSGFIPRHQLFFLGSFQLPWGIRANSIITASTGRRFNITNGVDTNYDSLFFERPTFAQLNIRCQELALTNSFCDMTGVSDPNAFIPRNYGKDRARSHESQPEQDLRIWRRFYCGRQQWRRRWSRRPWW